MSIFKKITKLLFIVLLAHTVSFYAFAFPGQADTDDDGIVDGLDVDDDNDGILDTVEGACSTDTSLNWNNTSSYGSNFTVNNINGSDVNVDFLATAFSGATIPASTGVYNVEGLVYNAGWEDVAATDANERIEYVFDFSTNVVVNQFIVKDLDRQVNFIDAVQVRAEDADGNNIPLINIPGSVLTLDTNGFYYSSSNLNSADTNVNHWLTINSNGRQIRKLTIIASPSVGGVGGVVPVNPSRFLFSDINLCTDTDTDTDTIPDHLDLDADNDGIADIYESGNSIVAGYDINGNGTLDMAGEGFIDDGALANAIAGNGLDDRIENNIGTGGLGVAPIDSFNVLGDNLPDYLDLDSDDDGIPDATEARMSNDYVAYPVVINTTSDIDNDGILNIYDNDGTAIAGPTTFGSVLGFFKTATRLVNTDSDDTADTIPDYLDLDADGDGINDTTEAGIITTAASYADPDGSVNDPFTTLTNIDDNNNGNDNDVDFRSIDAAPTITNGALPALDGLNMSAYPVNGTCSAPGDMISVILTDPSPLSTPAVMTTCQVGNTFDVVVDASSLARASINVESTIDDGINPSVSDTDTIGVDIDTDDDGNPDAHDLNPLLPTTTPDTITITAGDTLMIDVLANDDYLPNSDPNNLASTTLSDAGTGTAQGLISFDPTTGVLAYVPNALELNGAIVTIDYEVCNNSSGILVCNIDTLTITIDEKPSSSSRKGGSKRVSKKTLSTLFDITPMPDRKDEIVEVFDVDVSCPVFTQRMRQGDRDGRIGLSTQESGVSYRINEIKKLQTALTHLGYDPGPIDGIYGSQTKKGVSAWQVSHRTQVLDPWNLSGPTGWFYQSSERWMNTLLGCPESVILDSGKKLATYSDEYKYNAKEAPSRWQGLFDDWKSFLKL